MRLKPSSYLVLGMVNLGHRTGYAIKRSVDRSTRFFWAASLAQVYPELAALEQGGYVVSSENPYGARQRKDLPAHRQGQRRPRRVAAQRAHARLRVPRRGPPS